ncbi:uncharacterized protein LOC144635000 [Oculina patagonica]
MCSNTLIEAFGHIVFSFTQGVTEHYNPEEPEYTAESFGYDPLQSTGREWNYLPVDELIYQEYSDREATSLDYLASNSLDIKVINAFLPEEANETQRDRINEDRAMAWKRLRPSAIRTIWKSFYIGAMISLMTAAVIGTAYIFISYVCYQTFLNCQFQESIPEQMQWIRSISGVIFCGFLYMWYFASIFFLFRPYQLMGLKRKLILVCLLMYSCDSLYRVVLQALSISHSKLSKIQKIPLNVLFVMNVCFQSYLLTNHFRLPTRKQRLMLFLQLIVPGYFCLFLAIPVASLIYPAYNKQHEESKKLLIALFAPLIEVVLKVISRILVQRLWNITHPGYSYVLLAPLYCASAVMFRVLQADLGSLHSIAILGIIHGAVVERSTMVLIDHVCHVLWKRT